MKEVQLKNFYGETKKKLYFSEETEDKEIIDTCKQAYPNYALSINNVDASAVEEGSIEEAFKKEKKNLIEQLNEAQLTGDASTEQNVKEQYKELLEDYVTLKTQDATDNEGSVE